MGREGSRLRIEYRKFVAVMVMLSLSFTSAVAWSRPIGLSGSWLYTRTGDGTTSKNLLQYYNIDFGYDLSESMDWSGSFRYTRNWNNGRLSELYTPVVSLNTRNDIFDLGLSATAVEQRLSDSPDTSSKTWQANWKSKWDKPLWPALRGYFGQTWSTDDQRPKTTDTESFYNGIDADWSWGVLKTAYSYYYSDSKDKVNDSKSSTSRHMVSARAAKGFLDNRLNVSLSQNFSYYLTEATAHTGATGTALIEDNIVQAYAGNDTTPNTDLPAVNSGLTNDSTTDIAYSAAPGETTNIAIRMDFIRVDRIYLYTTTDLGATNASGFLWGVWTSPDGNTWTQQVTAQAYSYNSSSRRFEIPVSGIKARYIKLAAVQPLTSTVNFSEIKAYEEISGSGLVTSSRTYKDYSTDASVNYRPMDKVTLAYSLSLDFARPSGGVNTDRINQTGSLSWRPKESITSNLSITDSLQKDSGQPDSRTRAYSLNVITFPLDTLDVSTGVTRNETYEGGTKTATTDSYSIYTTAALFPDLNAGLDLVYTSADNLSSGTNTDSYNSRLNLTARLTPRITVDFYGGYIVSKSDTGDTDSTDTNLNLSWRPSDVLSFRASGYSNWASGHDNTRGGSLTIAWAATEKTQLSFGYSYAYSTVTTQTYNAFWSWRISRYLSTNVNGSYKIAEAGENSWTVSGQLTARFSGF